MALSLFAKLLMMESDSWKRELPLSATSEISWLTAMMIWRERREKEKRRRARSKVGFGLYLQVCAQEGLPLGVLVVVPHKQVEEPRGFRSQRGHLGHAALEHLAAQKLAKGHATFEQYCGELTREHFG